MAENQKKAKKPAPVATPVKSGPNTARRNSKAWKRRPCGQRHAPNGCAPCAARSAPSPEQQLKAMERREVREERDRKSRIAARQRNRTVDAG